MSKALVTIGKVMVAASVIGLGYIGYQEVKKLLYKFDFKIIGIGLPRLSDWVLFLPIGIRFINPTQAAINVDHVVVDLYLLKGGSYQRVAQLSQPVSIGPGESDSIIEPAIDLKAVFGGSIVDLALNVAANRKLTIRTVVTPTYKGITIPSQTFDNDVTI